MELGYTKLTERIIAAAIRVHKEIGPGFATALLTVKRVGREYHPRLESEEAHF